MVSKNKKRGLIARLQSFMSSYSGKVILNYAYSWGAAVVILGTLFKLTHLPGANIMLFVGMGTEVLVFLISAFDKPYKSYKWESVFPQIKINGAPDKEQDDNSVVDMQSNFSVNYNSSRSIYPNESVNNNSQVSFSDSNNIGATLNSNIDNHVVNSGDIANGSTADGGISSIRNFSVGTNINVGVDVDKIENMNSATELYAKQLSEMTESLERFHKSTSSLANISETLAESYKIISENSGNITANSQGYVHQMEILNRNLSGLNTIYEIQLHSISAQLDTIKQVNDGLGRIKEMYENSKDDSEKFHKETELMAKQIEELNMVYARMLQAMTVNMK